MDLREFGVLLEGVLCTECGLVFAVPREYFDARVADQRPFYCMNGHAVALGVPSGAEKLIRALEERYAAKQAEYLILRDRNFILLDQLNQANHEVVNLLVGRATAGGRQ